jgi:hypothetical protein
MVQSYLSKFLWWEDSMEISLEVQNVMLTFGQRNNIWIDPKVGDKQMELI